MTVWYAAFLFVLTVVLSVTVIFTVDYFMYSDAESKIISDTARIMENIDIEDSENSHNENDEDDHLYEADDGVAQQEESGETTISFEEDEELSDLTCDYAIFYANGEVCASSKQWSLLEETPESFDSVQKVESGDEDYLVYDKQVIEDDEVIGRVRVVSSVEQIENTIYQLAIVLVVSIPIFILLVVLGSLYIAGKSLRPIDNITKTAAKISKLDMTQRIEEAPTNDEVGRLTVTFNEMLNTLEEAFVRERQFSSDASHELKTPLAVIMATSESFLSEEVSVEEYKEAMSSIHSQSRKMNKIISQLLILTRGDEGKFTLEKEKLNLAPMLDDIIRELHDYADDQGVTINHQNKGDVYVFADHMLVTQVFINVIGNACKYGRIGGYVNVKTEVSERFATIIVEDNGIGIAEENLKHIFKRFYRADQSHTGDGSGLGLSIVKWIIDVHNGEIEVESVLGEGTVIKLRLPLDEL